MFRSLGIAAVATAVLATFSGPSIAQNRSQTGLMATQVQTEERSPDEIEAIRRRLAAFVVDRYLGTGVNDHENQADLYADQVDYYGRDRSRSEVLAAKKAYYRRWPSRRYDLAEKTLQPKPGPDDSIEISFRYSYTLTSGERTARGIGTTTLGVVMLRDGRFEIIKENGRVLQSATKP